MGRLCERPGCSEPASVAYGMRPEDLIFWLDHLLETTNINDAGALCRRHADSMIVPRDWTLDDQRDPDLHLFRPPDATGGIARRARSAPSAGDDTEQLELGVDIASDDTRTAESSAADTVGDDDAGAAADDAAVDAAGEREAADTVEPWTPSFDSSDDLGGLLSARSPLLARAFRGDDRPAR